MSVRDAINVSTRISPQVARRIVLDVIGDLAIARDAISHRAPELAADVARFPWIDELVSTICATNGPLVESSYQIAHATVTVAKRTSGQVYPEIDVELEGTEHETTLTRSSPPRRLAEHSDRYRNTLVVTKADGHWLVCGNRTDPRTAACITAT